MTVPSKIKKNVFSLNGIIRWQNSTILREGKLCRHNMSTLNFEPGKFSTDKSFFMSTCTSDAPQVLYSLE